MPEKLRRTIFLVLALACSVTSLLGQVRELEKHSTRSARASSAAPLELQGAPFRVVHYALDLTLGMIDESFAGHSRITLVMNVASDSLPLNQLKLAIDSVDADGMPQGFRTDDQLETLTVRLSAVRLAGDTVSLDIYYRRDPAIARSTLRLGYFYFHDTIPGLPANLGYTMSEPSDARCWMPCLDEPDVKATAAISVTVPSGYVAASNGKFLGATDNGNGTSTWRWREDHQIATYLMCATVSQFTVPRLSFVRAPGDTIPLEYFAWARDSAVTASFLPTVSHMITNLSALFGPYPWEKYGMSSVSPFSYGGMEHQTITTLNEAVQADTEVVVHELAHQWWGDLVTCASWPDVWLNEGFATYSQALWRESLGGPQALQASMLSMQDTNSGSWTGAVYDPVSQGFDLFSEVVYSKAAWALHALRGVVGDSAFFGSLRRWRLLYGESSGTTSQFEAAVESVTLSDMRWFFDEWIYGKGWPVYSFASAWSGGVLTARLVQQQAGTKFIMPVRIRAYSHGTDTTFVAWDSLQTQDFRFPLAARPDSVLFDPDHWIFHQNGAPVSPTPPPAVPVQFALQQNYPNPFNLTTEIVYDVPGNAADPAAQSYVTLTVYDVIGRKVATLFDGIQSPAEYRYRFGNARLASGVYFYRLRVQPPEGGVQTAVRKMVLAK